MTLIVALKYKNGSILATDTRIMYGFDMKMDHVGKIEFITDKSGVASAGLSGAADDIIRAVKNFCDSRPISFDDLCSCLSDKSLEWYEKNIDKMPDEDGTVEELYGFIAVSPERIRKIDGKGYSEESYNYACDGSGLNYGLYILQNHYKENLEEKDAKELAVYTILETSKMDPSVGEDIQMAIFPKRKKYNIIGKDETCDIKACLAPISMEAIKLRNEKIENIIKIREELNNLWKKKFKFKLLNQNEKAIFQITLPCRSENEFTNNIAALFLLVDQLNTEELKKNVDEKEGSINILKSFLNKEIKDYPEEIISNFRDIITLRSKKFPIHPTDVKFLEVVIKLTGKYPPNWSELYLKSLDLYKDSLIKLSNCLKN